MVRWINLWCTNASYYCLWCTTLLTMEDPSPCVRVNSGIGLALSYELWLSSKQIAFIFQRHHVFFPVKRKNSDSSSADANIQLSSPSFKSRCRMNAFGVQISNRGKHLLDQSLSLARDLMCNKVSLIVCYSSSLRQVRLQQTIHLCLERSNHSWFLSQRLDSMWELALNWIRTTDL